MNMFHKIKEILISEKKNIETNYEKFKKSKVLHKKKFNKF